MNYKALNRALLSLVALCLSACSSIPVEQVESRISAWKGQHIDELFKYWGLPSRQQHVGDRHYAEWINQSSEPGNAAVSIGTGTRSRHTGIGIGLTLFDLGGKDDECSRLVTYDSNSIVNQITWQGTNDYCYEVTPSLEQIQQNAQRIQH
ncbi:hypothetical protein [Aliikangiella sp. G2MR2-5]|uniref:hypothetical protein n=1 Tax=Aliikangiella sp. G2MR2-5 TaxID=2788943 RepID=UPI0018A90615|nr:hypothetical protein [Aliikangiella sp. G2MR2-5]